MEKDFFGMELFPSPMWFTWIIWLNTSLQHHLRTAAGSKPNKNFLILFKSLRGGARGQQRREVCKAPTRHSCLSPRHVYDDPTSKRT